MSATEDRVDIVVVDRVSEEPARKIKYLGEVAKDAHERLKALKTSLRDIDSSAVRKLQKEMADGAKQNARAAVAQERIAQAQLRTAQVGARLEAQQAKVNNVLTQGTLIQQRLTNAQLAGERVAAAMVATRERSLRGIEREGDAMVKLFQRVEQERAKQAARAAQMDFNSVLGIGGSSKSARASAGVFGDAARQEKELAALTRRAEQLKGAVDPLYAAQAAFNRTQNEANTLLARGVITQAEHTRIVQMATQALHQHAGAQRLVGDAAKLTRFQMLTLQYTVNDVVASLASGANPLTILLQQGGQVTQAWGGLGNTMRAAAGAILTVKGAAVGLAAAGAGLLALADSNRAEFSRLNRTLEATGGYANLTGGMFLSMADDIAEATRQSVGSARETALEYAKSGKLQREQIEQLSVVTLNLSRTTGESVEKIQKDMMRLPEGPSKALSDLNERFNFLTASQYNYIRALEETGQHHKALTESSRILYDYFGKEAPQNLGYLEAAWRTVSMAVSDAMRAVREFGRADTTQEQLASAQKALSDLEKHQKNMGSGGYARDQRDLQLARDRVKELLEAADAENRAAQAAARRAEIQKQGIAAVQRLDGYSASIADNSVKAQQAVEAFRRDLEAAGKADPTSATFLNAKANQAAIEAGIRKKFMPSEARAASKDEKEQERYERALERVYGQVLKSADGVGLLRAEQDKLNRVREIEIALAGKGFKLNEQQRSEIEEMVSATRDAEIHQEALNRVYDAATQPMETYNANVRAVTALLNAGVISQAEATRQLNLYRDQLVQMIDPFYDIQKALNDEAALLGLVGDELENASRMQQIEQQLRSRGIDLNAEENKGRRDSIKNQIAENQQRAKTQKALDSYYRNSVGAAKDLAVEQDALKEAMARGYVGATDYAYGLAEIEMQLSQLRVAMGQGTMFDSMTIAFVSNIGRMEDALVQFRHTGSLNVKALVNDMIDDFLRIQVFRPILGSAISGIFGGGGVGAAGGGVLGSIGTSIAGSAITNSLGLGSLGSSIMGGLGSFGTGLSTTLGNGLIGGFGTNMANIATMVEGGSFGMAAGAAVPYVGAALAVASLLGGMGGGETRSGATYRNGQFAHGPSGGQIDGAQDLTVGTIAGINDILARAGSGTRISDFVSALEQSKRGKGFAYAGGTLSNGRTFGEFTESMGRSNRRGSMTAEEAMAAYAEELKQAAMEALRAADIGGSLGNLLAEDMSVTMERVQKIMDERAQIEERLFDLTATALEKLNKQRAAEIEAVDEINRNRMRQVHAQEDVNKARDALLDVYNQSDARAFVEGIRNFIGDLVLNDPTMMTAGRTATASASYQTDLALARAGDKSARARLTSSAGTYADAALDSATTAAEYGRVVDRIRMDLTDAASFEEQQIKLMEDQLKAMGLLNDNVTTWAQAWAEYTKAQDKLEAAKAAVAAEEARKAVIPVLGPAGPAVDPATIPFSPEWYAALNASRDYSGAGNGGFAVGTNYVPHDMMTMVHEGERIIPAWDNPYANPYTSDDGSSRELLNEFARFHFDQNEANFKIVAVLQDIYRLFERWDAEGMPAVDPEWEEA